MPIKLILTIAYFIYIVYESLSILRAAVALK